MKVKVLEDYLHYKAGKNYDLNEPSAVHLLKRGKAEAVDGAAAPPPPPPPQKKGKKK